MHRQSVPVSPAKINKYHGRRHRQPLQKQINCNIILLTEVLFLSRFVLVFRQRLLPIKLFNHVKWDRYLDG